MACGDFRDILTRRVIARSQGVVAKHERRLLDKAEPAKVLGAANAAKKQAFQAERPRR